MRRALLVGLALLLGGCGTRIGAGAAHPGNIAMDPRVERDIGLGFTAYRQALARWGDWEADDWYGVRWCPNDPPPGFVPYRSRGHWTPATHPVGAAPQGAPYWVSDDADTWGDITMHHGWWVNLAERSSSWCWIPGAQATAGRVVWRTGDGFVGWAPEAPVWVDDGGDGAIAGLAWTFVLLGALFEPELPPQYLEGDACEVAAAATSPTRAVEDPRAPAVAHVGPSSDKVARARELLVRQAADHVTTTGVGGGEPTKLLQVATASTETRGSAKADSSSKSSASSDKKKDKLPSGMVLYTSVESYPMMGPMGLVPILVRPDPPDAETIGSSSVAASEGPSSNSSSASTWSGSSSSYETSHVGGESRSSYGSSSSYASSSSHASSVSHASTSSSYSSSSRGSSSSSGSHSSSHIGSMHR